MSKRVGSADETVKDSLFPLRQMVQTRQQAKEEAAQQSKNMSSNNQSSIGHSALTLRKYDGKNFSVWKSQLEAYMQVKECIDVLYTTRPVHVIGDKDTETTSQLQTKWDDRNKLARAVILMALYDEQAIMVCHLDTAKEIWDRLLEANEQRSQSSRVVLMRQFCDSAMRDGEKVLDYITRVQRIFIQLKEAGTMVTEETLVGRIVGGLTQSFHVFITNWGNNPNVKQTMAELIPRLTAEEILIRRFKKADPMAMVSEAGFKNRRPSQGNNSSGRPPSNRSKKSLEDLKEKYKCHKCGEKGHFRAECKSGSGNKSTPTKSSAEEAVVAEGIIAEANAAVDEGEWILDTGATEHMTHDGSNFVSFEKLRAQVPSSSVDRWERSA